MSIQAFLDEQGWTPATSLIIALDFIESQSMSAEFSAYLERRATTERTLTDPAPLPLNIRDAMDDYDPEDQDTGALYLCEMGVFDDEDPGTAYDSFELLGVADSPSGAEAYVAQWLSTHPLPRFASASFSLMAPAQPIKLQEHFYQDDDGEWRSVI